MKASTCYFAFQTHQHRNLWSNHTTPNPPLYTLMTDSTETKKQKIYKVSKWNLVERVQRAIRQKVSLKKVFFFVNK